MFILVNIRLVQFQHNRYLFISAILINKYRVMVSQLLQFLNLLSFRPISLTILFPLFIIQKKKEIKYLPRTQLVKYVRR